MSELIRPRPDWTQGVQKIHKDTQASLKRGERADVTADVLGLAERTWGKHDFSPHMQLQVVGESTYLQAPYIYVSDRSLRHQNGAGNLQGGYIDPKSGLFVMQEPLLVYDWLNGRVN